MLMSRSATMLPRQRDEQQMLPELFCFYSKPEEKQNKADVSFDGHEGSSLEEKSLDIPSVL